MATAGNSTACLLVWHPISKPLLQWTKDCTSIKTIPWIAKNTCSPQLERIGWDAADMTRCVYIFIDIICMYIYIYVLKYMSVCPKTQKMASFSRKLTNLGGPQFGLARPKVHLHTFTVSPRITSKKKDEAAKSFPTFQGSPTPLGSSWHSFRGFQ